MATTGARRSDLFSFTSVQTGELAALVETEASLEEDAVREDDSVADGEVDGSRGVHGDATQSGRVSGGDRAFVEDSLHGEDTVGTLGVGVTGFAGHLLGVEGSIRESHRLSDTGVGGEGLGGGGEGEGEELGGGTGVAADGDA